MARKSIKTERIYGRAQFAIPDVVGRWKSREGSPEVRIFQKPEYNGKGFFIEFTYGSGVVFKRPLLILFGKIYFDLFGHICLAYDADRDVLQLSGYGDYFRADD